MDRNHVDRSHAEQELYRVDESRKEHCLHFTGKEWGGRVDIMICRLIVHG